MAYRLSNHLWLFGGSLSAQRFVDTALESVEVDFDSTNDVKPIHAGTMAEAAAEVPS